MSKNVQKIETKKPLIPKRKKVCAYARVSSGKDAMIHSLSAQISYYSEYIQSNGEWEYAGVYADTAVTGTKEAREEFQKMLEDCRGGKIDMVITKSISRFARNTVTLLSTVRELKEHGVDIWFEKENIHSVSGDGELLLTILASFAQEESLSVSENCKWRIRHNYEVGIPNNFRVYGYHVQNQEIRINEEQAAVVKKIFDMYVKGEGTYKITNYLKENGIKPPNGHGWRPKTVAGILKNEKYIGDLRLQKFYSENHITKRKITNHGELKQYYVSENHEAIVDKETFDAVQKIFKKKNEKSPYVEPYEYQFKGMVFCGICGDKYTRKKINGGTVSETYAWKCHTYSHKGKRSCPSKQIHDTILIKMAETVNKEIVRIFILENNRVQFIFADGTDEIQTWEIDRTWSDEMKERNYYNQRKRCL